MERSILDDRSDLVQSVLSSSAIMDIKRRYLVDTEKYSWVKQYLRDKKLREEIKLQEKRKLEILNSPMHRDEIKETFKNELVRLKSMRLSNIQSHLLLVQERKASISEFNILPCFLISLTKEEIDIIFSKISGGVRQKDIEASVEKIEDDIVEMRREILSELSPEHRWIYYPEGGQMLYPGGCRWTIFVEDWGKVVSRFVGAVNINGCAICSPEEQGAYYALGLDKVRKLTPLREPKKLIKPVYGLGPDYGDSIRIEPLR